MVAPTGQQIQTPASVEGINKGIFTPSPIDGQSTDSISDKPKTPDAYKESDTQRRKKIWGVDKQIFLLFFVPIAILGLIFVIYIYFERTGWTIAIVPRDTSAEATSTARSKAVAEGVYATSTAETVAATSTAEVLNAIATASAEAVEATSTAEAIAAALNTRTSELQSQNFSATAQAEFTVTAEWQRAQIESATVKAEATSTADAKPTSTPTSVPTRTPTRAPIASNTPTLVPTLVPTQTPTPVPSPTLAPAPQPVDGLGIGEPFRTNPLVNYEDSIPVLVQVFADEQVKSTVARIDVQANFTFANGAQGTREQTPITSLASSASMTINWPDGFSNAANLGQVTIEFVFTPIDKNQVRRASITRSLDLVACSFQMARRKSSYWNVTQGGRGPLGNDPTYMDQFEANTLVCLIGRADCPASPNPIVKLVTEDTLDQGKDGWAYASGPGFLTFDSAAIDGLPPVPSVGPPSCALP